MIGKIMSEAAHSIIGMFSAKPLGMENNASHSDFGSLLRSPEEQPHFVLGAQMIDGLDDENVGVGETNPAPAQHWETTNVLPFINQSFGNKIFNQDPISQKVEQDQIKAVSDGSIIPDDKLSLTFNRDGMISSDIRTTNGFTAFAANGESRQAEPALVSGTHSPQANVILGNGPHINMTPTLAVPDVVDGRPVKFLRPAEQVPEVTDVHKYRTPRLHSFGNAVGSEILPTDDKGFVKQSEQSDESLVGNGLRNNQPQEINRSRFRSQISQNSTDPANLVSSAKGVMKLPAQPDEALVGNGNRNDQSDEITRSQFRSQIGENSVDSEALVSSAKGVIKLPEQTAAVSNGNSLRDRQLQKTGEPSFRPDFGLNDVSEGMFPSSEKGLLKLQSLQPQMRGQSGEPAASAAEIQKLNKFESPDVERRDQVDKSEPGKLSVALSPLVMKGAEHKDARSELTQFGLRSSPRDVSLVAPTALKDSVIAESEFVEPVKLESQLVNKSLEKSIEQQPVTNSSAQLAVRETIQRPVSFDMSSPQIGERLASEIADVSVTGGTKKFELNPRNLGRMEITFTTRGSTEVIEIQTEHRAAKDMIIQHSQVLQEILKSQGRDDLTFRVDVKENMFTSTRNEGGHLAQQESRDAREQQARPSQRRQFASSFDSAAENDPASDNSRYA